MSATVTRGLLAATPLRTILQPSTLTVAMATSLWSDVTVKGARPPATRAESLPSAVSSLFAGPGSRPSGPEWPSDVVRDLSCDEAWWRITADRSLFRVSSCFICRPGPALYRRYLCWSLSTYVPEVANELLTVQSQAMFIVNYFMRLWDHRMIYDRVTTMTPDSMEIDSRVSFDFKEPGVAYSNPFIICSARVPVAGTYLVKLEKEGYGTAWRRVEIPRRNRGARVTSWHAGTVFLFPDAIPPGAARPLLLSFRGPLAAHRIWASPKGKHDFVGSLNIPCFGDCAGCAIVGTLHSLSGANSENYPI